MTAALENQVTPTELWLFDAHTIETFKSAMGYVQMIIGNSRFSIMSQGKQRWFYTLEKRTFEIKCTDCGKTAMVPFKPTVGKPVYCKTCFSKHSSRPERAHMRSSFDLNQAWARRGDNWTGRKEQEPVSVFRQS